MNDIEKNSFYPISEFDGERNDSVNFNNTIRNNLSKKASRMGYEDRRRTTLIDSADAIGANDELLEDMSKVQLSRRQSDQNSLVIFHSTFQTLLSATV